MPDKTSAKVRIPMPYTYVFGSKDDVDVEATRTKKLW